MAPPIGNVTVPVETLVATSTSFAPSAGALRAVSVVSLQAVAATVEIATGAERWWSSRVTRTLARMSEASDGRLPTLNLR